MQPDALATRTSLSAHLSFTYGRFFWSNTCVTHSQTCLYKKPAPRTYSHTNGVLHKIPQDVQLCSRDIARPTPHSVPWASWTSSLRRRRKVSR
jgi:hypothetical protein